jgi:hypothetical protein
VDYNSPVAMNKSFVSVARVCCHARQLLNRASYSTGSMDWASDRAGSVRFSLANKPSLYWLGPNPQEKYKGKADIMAALK